MTEELKPCPFCGGEAKVHGNLGQPTEYFFVTCADCLIEKDDESKTPQQAIAAWNTRHGEK